MSAPLPESMTSDGPLICDARFILAEIAERQAPAQEMTRADRCALAAEIARRWNAHAALVVAAQAALDHAGGCLCCRTHYEGLSVRPAMAPELRGVELRHDDDCYIAKARAALRAAKDGAK